MADVELDPPRLAALVDAFLETGTCPAPAETSSAESLFVGGGDPSWLSVGDRVVLSRQMRLRAQSPTSSTRSRTSRVLLYDDAAPRRARGGRGPRARLGATVDEGAASLRGGRGGRGLARGRAPVAFDRGRLLRGRRRRRKGEDAAMACCMFGDFRGASARALRPRELPGPLRFRMGVAKDPP